MPDAGLPHEGTTARQLLARSMARLRVGAAGNARQRIEQLEAALEAANQQLQQQAAAVRATEAAMLTAQRLQATGRLAGGIAHDFNNHLATILGSLELIERRIATAAPAAEPTEADRMQPWIDRGIEAVQRAALLTSCLMALSRRQRGTGRPADLNMLVHDVVLLAAGTLGRGVAVETVLAGDIWPIAADAGQVETAMLNLCLNARDAMPEGGVLTIATGNVTLAEPDPDALPAGDYVRITVADTGCGMTKDVAAQARSAFFSTKGETACGLGLTQVANVARQGGGALRIVSRPGTGTEVIVLLPRA